VRQKSRPIDFNAIVALARSKIMGTNNTSDAIGVGGQFRLGEGGENNLPEYSEPDRSPFGP